MLVLRTPESPKRSTMLQASTILLALGLVIWSVTWTGVLDIPMEVFWALTIGGICMLLMHIASTRRSSNAC